MGYVELRLATICSPHTGTHERKRHAAGRSVLLRAGETVKQANSRCTATVQWIDLVSFLLSSAWLALFGSVDRLRNGDKGPGVRYLPSTSVPRSSRHGGSPWAARQARTLPAFEAYFRNPVCR